MPDTILVRFTKVISTEDGIVSNFSTRLSPHTMIVFRVVWFQIFTDLISLYTIALNYIATQCFPAFDPNKLLPWLKLT